jgi:hypothetical protein
MKAMTAFLSDFDDGVKQGRYVDASLPFLPFQDEQFQLTLCSHFLFLYSEKLDLDFHIKAILELLRVSSEVRIFPIIDLENKTSRHLERIRSFCKEHEFRFSLKKVDYEFQFGGNKMAVIERK